MTDPTPITTDDSAQEPTTTPVSEMSDAELFAIWDTFCAAVRDVGQDLKAQQEAEAA
jgi:hypothetical protein